MKANVVATIIARRVAGVAKTIIIYYCQQQNKNIIKKLESKYITEYPKVRHSLLHVKKGI